MGRRIEWSVVGIGVGVRGMGFSCYSGVGGSVWWWGSGGRILGYGFFGVGGYFYGY